MSDWNQSEAQENFEVAIVGMAGRFPGAKNLDEFWQNLREGVESILLFTDQQLESFGVSPAALRRPNFVKAGSILEGVDLFDARFFGYSPREAEIIDPQHRIFLECAWEALENAACDPERYEGLIGVFAGTSLSTYLLFNILTNPKLANAEDNFHLMIGNDKDFLSTRVSYELNLKGPSLNVQTGCSTSLVATHLACQSLLSYQCDMALAGGVSVNVPQRTGYYYQEGGINSPDGHCRAFDARARGTIFGSGVGIVVLKRLEEALQDGDTIHAIIKGSAVNNDGSSKVGYTAPSIDGQAEVIARAQAVAGVGAETISYVEAHGTGTDLGDPVEIAALTKAFTTGENSRQQYCALGTVKTNIGHLDAAAGIAGLIKTALALKHGEMPASLHYEEPNPQIEFAATPFYVNTSLKAWETENGVARRAGVSSFGVGGTNAHVILEEAPVESKVAGGRQWQVLVLSAKTETALEAATARLADHLEAHPEADLADVAYTLQTGRQVFDYRRAVICHDASSAVEALRTLDPQRVVTARREAVERAVAFMFPGGGAQYPNMCRDLYRDEATFRQQVDLCAQILTPRLGYDIRQYLYPEEGDHAAIAARMKQTSLALPALFSIEYALAKLWMSWGVRPAALIGHSLGEYVAACLAGVMSLEDALALVVLRGQLFEQLPNGAMLGVGLSEEEVRPLLSAGLSVAAVNGPGTCVVAGPGREIEDLARRLDEGEIECRRLQINVAAHSQMVEPILEPFARFVEQLELSLPQLPYVSNVTGQWITAEETTDPRYWVRHLRQTVRFKDGIEKLLEDGQLVLLEAGPGQTLSLLARMQAGKRGALDVVASTRHPQDHQADTEALAKALGRLWLAGIELDWKSYYAGENRRRLPLPTYPFERQRYWIDLGGAGGHVSGRGAEDAGKLADMAEWFYTPSWKRTVPPAAQEAQGEGRRRWLIFEDRGGMGAALADGLEQHGQRVTRVISGERFSQLDAELYTINPGRAGDYESLLQSLTADSQVPDAVVHLLSVTAGAETSGGPDAFRRAQGDGFYSLLFLAQALGTHYNSSDPLDLCVVSNEVHMVESADNISAEKSTLLSLCKVIPQEFENISCRFLDVGPIAGQVGQRDAATEQVRAEITARRPDRVVAYRRRHRWVQSFEPVPLGPYAESVWPLREGGIYLITGGTGGIGQILAEYLARRVRARLALLGRRAWPPREQWDAWLADHDEQDETSRQLRRARKLEALGAEVMLVSADVASEPQMRLALLEVEQRFGAVHGVIHAAGVTGAKAVNLISQIEPAECEAQFRAKVYGLYTLEKVFEGKVLDFCALFSSTASILGGPGLAGYAAANLFMDSFAASRASHEGTRWLSLNWDGWQIPEEDRADALLRTSLDQYVMTPEEGVEAFQRAVVSPAPGQLLISTGDLHARLEQWTSGGGEDVSGAEGPASLHARPDLGTAYVPPSNEVERVVARVWQELLGIEQLGIHDNFFELGGSSLIGLKVIARLKKELQADIPVVALFEGPTVSALAKTIACGQAQPNAYEKNRDRGERRRERVRRKQTLASAL